MCVCVCVCVTVPCVVELQCVCVCVCVCRAFKTKNVHVMQRGQGSTVCDMYIWLIFRLNNVCVSYLVSHTLYTHSIHSVPSTIYMYFVTNTEKWEPKE